jgi:hypothetical protein
VEVRRGAGTSSNHESAVRARRRGTSRSAEGRSERVGSGGWVGLGRRDDGGRDDGGRDDGGCDDGARDDGARDDGGLGDGAREDGGRGDGAREDGGRSAVLGRGRGAAAGSLPTGRSSRGRIRR